MIKGWRKEKGGEALSGEPMPVGCCNKKA